MCGKAALLAVAVALLGRWMSAPAASGATLTVGPKTAACSNAQYLTIQSAVNAASSGDTIHVCAGTYSEQVLINKSVVVNGDNGTVISPANVVANSSSFTSGNSIAAIVLVQDTTGVTIQNVIVDGSGNGLGECSPDLTGVFYQNASGVLNHVTVRAVELGAGLTGCQSGLGVFVQSENTSSVVTIENSSIHDYQKGGIVANEVGTQVTVSGNVVTGLGTAAGTAQNGIQIGYGAAGTVHANTVANHVYSCTDVAGCPAGILVYQSDGVTVDHNELGVSETGIAIVADTATVLDNTVFDSLSDGVRLEGNGNAAKGNYITRSDHAAVVISGNTNSVQQEHINDAAVGILTISGSAGNTVSGNIYYNTPVLTQDPPAHAVRRVSPYR